MDLSTLALQAIGGFMVGALIGYAARKLAGWFLLLLGLLLLPIYGLWSIGVLSINWSAVNEIVGKIVSWLGVHFTNATEALASAGALGVSGLIGFLFGFAAPLKHCVAPPTERRFVKRR